jgi:PAS domain S-box-containing protein
MPDRQKSQRHGPPAFVPSIGLREVLEASPDLVFSTDAWGRLVWASPSFESLTGRRVKDCVGHTVLELLAPSHVREAKRLFIEARRRSPESVGRRVELLTSDNRTVPVDVHLRIAENGSGERFSAGVGRTSPAADSAAVTPGAPASPSAERMSELERNLAEARQVAQVKGDFLATLSHEMRTPMSGVISMTDMLLQGELAPEQRPLVELIRESTQTLVTLISDALDYSRLEAGRMAVDSLDFDLRVTVDQVSGVLHSLATGKSLGFESRVHALVPSRLKGDPGRVRQVILNLGSNAVRFSEQGTVSVSVTRESEDDSKVGLLFEVSGSGDEMDAETLAKLFEPPLPAEAASERRGSGSGLGLAISRRLVEAMGGELGVASKPGAGTTFWFKLGFEKQPVTVGSPAAPVADVALRGVRVLVADGNPTDREPVAMVLRAWGCDVDLADNGPEALRLVRESAAARRGYALAVLDRHLEGMNGEELGMAIRADEDLGPVRLIMVTNVGRPGDGGRVKAAGFSGYLMKPLGPSQLYEAIAEVLHPSHSDEPQQDRPLVTRHSLAEARRGKLRLLLVDDDPVNQLVTTSALHRVGYNVEVAHNGHRAIELTESERWDLILMDMQMPDLDGCRTTSAIRARERGAWRTPIIGLTANADHKADRERCLASGMDLVLGKPINLEQLTHAVERFTSREGNAVEPEEVRPTPKLTVISAHFDAPAIKHGTHAEKPEKPWDADIDSDDIPEIPEGPAIDLEQLEAACMGLPALRSSLLHTFLIDVPGRLDRLRYAFEAGDLRRVEFESHGLRGMCATIGAAGCTLLFGEMEERARADRVDAARLLLEPAIEESQRTEQFIRRFDAIVTREVA